MRKNRIICFVWITLITLTVAAMIVYVALANKYGFYSPKV